MRGRYQHAAITRVTLSTALGLLGVTGLGVCGAATIPGTNKISLPLEAITSRMAQVDERKHATLPDFAVMRKYVLHNLHMKRDAEMLVRVTYSKANGKTFKVVESSGVEGISKKVFQHLIEAEKEASKSDNLTRGSIRPENYTFELLGTEIQNGRNCYVLAIHPHAKTKFVFNGKVWVDAEDFAVAKLEGHPAANISFWVGKPLITQTWHKTGDFWMAATNSTHSDSMILGSSELTVQSSGYLFGSTSARLN